jgi:ADP-heptose:LPS heptosyltransferase
MAPAGGVLVVRSDNIGDVLLAGPAVRAVAASGAAVTLCCSPQGLPAARLLPGVEAVDVAALPWIDADPQPVDGARLARLVEHFAALRPREAIILTSFHQSPLPLALVLRAAGFSRIVANSVDYPGSLLDRRVQVDDGLHEVERSLRIVEAAGYVLPADDDRRLRVTVPEEPEPTPGMPEPPYVVVHPGASVPARAWGAAPASAAVAALSAAGHRTVITGGHSERALTARVAGAAARRGPSPLDLGGRCDLPGLARVLAGAAAVVVGNTGPAHLAAAVGAPVVSLYAPTVPAQRWRPWGVPHLLLGDLHIGCAGCRARVCPVAGHPCLAAVTPRAVVEAVEEVAR